MRLNRAFFTNTAAGIASLGLVYATSESLSPPMRILRERLPGTILKELARPEFFDDDHKNDPVLKYDYLDALRIQNRIYEKRNILKEEKKGTYPSNITRHLLKLLEWEIDRNFILDDAPVTLINISEIFSNLNKLHELGYCTKEDINKICSDDLIEGLDPNDRIVEFVYIRKLMGKITDRLKQVIETTQKLDDTARFALLGYSNLFVSSSIYSPAKQLKLLLKLLTKLDNGEITSADFPVILSNDKRTQAFIKGGLPAVLAL